MNKCPWCREGIYTKATFGGDDVRVPCGYCGGSGEYARWAEHPEYTRQRNDLVLRRAGVIFP